MIGWFDDMASQKKRIFREYMALERRNSIQTIEEENMLFLHFTKLFTAVFDSVPTFPFLGTQNASLGRAANDAEEYLTNEKQDLY